MKTWQRILWFTIGLLTGIFWSALAHAEPMTNSGSATVEMTAEVTKTNELDVLPETGPHQQDPRDIYMTDDETQVYVEDVRDTAFEIVKTDNGVEIQF